MTRTQNVNRSRPHAVNTCSIKLDNSYIEMLIYQHINMCRLFIFKQELKYVYDMLMCLGSVS